MKQFGTYLLFFSIVFLILENHTNAQESWVQLENNGEVPTERRGTVGIHDENNQRLIFQGGETASVDFLSDTFYYVLNSNEWTKPSLNNPSPRCHHTFLIDKQNNRALLFGGFPRTNELWQWDLENESWSNITPENNNPDPRCLHTSVICKSRNEMIVYGGLKGSFFPDLDDLWSLNLTSHEWTQIESSAPPGKLYGHVAAIDEKRDRMIVFGGLTLQGERSTTETSRLWEYDLETQEWNELNVDGPSARQFARGFALANGNGMLIFGGKQEDEFYNDLWFLNFNTMQWQKIKVSGELPAPRFRHTLVYDPSENRIWTGFGEGENNQHFNDLWRLDLNQLGVSAMQIETKIQEWKRLK